MYFIFVEIINLFMPKVTFNVNSLFIIFIIIIIRGRIYFSINSIYIFEAFFVHIMCQKVIS